MKKEPKAGPLAPLRRHPHLLEINTYAWLERLSRAASRRITLAEVPDSEWDRLCASGFDIVYLLGVWERSPAGRRLFRTDPAAFSVFDRALPGWTLQSVVGSPFSIRSYAPEPRIGTWDALDAARAALNARGMRLVLDFVSNHTGPDHVWATAHPECFLQGGEADYRRDPAAFHCIEPEHGPALFVARGRDPYFPPWADTAQLDHFAPQTRAALIGVLRTIAGHCDGVRCDMAMLALNDVFAQTWRGLLGDRRSPEREFWSEAIAALPADFLWIAEVYWDLEARLLELGFDYAYDKRLYDRLLGGDAEGVRAHLAADVEYQQRMARFIENHDERRSVAAFGRERIPGLAAMLATLPGLRFFHDGQFEGRSIHLPMALAAAADESPDRDLERRYAELLGIANAAAFHDGDWRLLVVRAECGESWRTLVAYRWRAGAEYWLVVVNLGAEVAHGRIILGHELDACSTSVFTDAMDGAVYRRERPELLARGLYVRLAGYQAHLFRVEPAD